MKIAGLTFVNLAVIFGNSFALLKDMDSKKYDSEGGSVEDECGRVCTCENGKFVQCCRMRKEFTNMTRDERIRYIETIKHASSDPRYKPYYERLLTKHKLLFHTTIHTVKYFLPWHRWFILQYENLLRKIDCRVTVPYWDWSKVANDISADPLWDASGDSFGGDGTSPNHCVKTGPFNDSAWSLIDSAGDACLKRRFNGRVPSTIHVERLLEIYQDPSHFTKFSICLAGYFHVTVHCVVGETMCSDNAASAPEFFLHHAFVDKIWWEWQSFSDNNKYIQYFVDQPGHMPGTKAESKDYLDLNDMRGATSGRVCAKYVESLSPINKIIRALPKKALRSIPSEPLPPVSKRVMKVFHISRKQLKQWNEHCAPINTSKILKWSLLSKEDALGGFKMSAVLKAKDDSKRGIFQPEYDDEYGISEDYE